MYNKFKTPLIQSAVILVAVAILFNVIGTSEAGSSGSSFWAMLCGIGNTILFLIGLSIGVSFCIAILFGIFLAAVAMVDKAQASNMYCDLKKNVVLVAR